MPEVFSLGAVCLAVAGVWAALTGDMRTTTIFVFLACLFVSLSHSARRRQRNRTRTTRITIRERRDG